MRTFSNSSPLPKHGAIAVHSLARVLLQRKCACGGTLGPTGECEECRRKREAGMSQRATDHPSSFIPHPSEVPPIVHEMLRAPGQPQDGATRAFMEPRFGHDFSQVLVHADASSPEKDEREVNTSSSEVESESEPESSEEANDLKPRPPEKRTTMVERHQERFSAVIGRAAKPQPSASDGHVVFEGPNHEPREGETLRLPDLFISPLAACEQTDAVASTFSYSSTIKKAGAAPPAGDFGITRPFFQMKMSGTQDSGSFKVTCDVEGQITFQLSNFGRTDISSDSDSDITKSNYPKVVSDLTPNMSDLNGRPPRTEFWAEDLTERHERFHAVEDVGFGRDGVLLAEKWLNKQTAASVDEVKAHVSQALNIIKTKVDNEMAPPGSEKRAYGDGASLYAARTKAIKTKGDAGKYATAPTPTGKAKKK
jgi:hypothetical protein